MKIQRLTESLDACKRCEGVINIDFCGERGALYRDLQIAHNKLAQERASNKEALATIKASRSQELEDVSHSHCRDVL